MTKLFFKNDEEELNFYREFKSKKSWEVQEEILKLLDLPYEQEKWEERLYLLSLGKTVLLLLRNAIKNKLKKEQD